MNSFSIVQTVIEQLRKSSFFQMWIHLFMILIEES